MPLRDRRQQQLLRFHQHPGRRRLGFGGFEIINLFAFIATKPTALKALPSVDLSAAERYYWTTAAKAYHTTSEEYWSNSERLAMAAWGAEKVAMRRTAELLKVFRGNKLICLGRTQSGQPNHPLMLAYATRHEIFQAPLGSPEAVLMGGTPEQS